MQDPCSNPILVLECVGKPRNIGHPLYSGYLVMVYTCTGEVFVCFLWL